VVCFPPRVGSGRSGGGCVSPARPSPRPNITADRCRDQPADLQFRRSHDNSFRQDDRRVAAPPERNTNTPRTFSWTNSGGAAIAGSAPIPADQPRRHHGNHAAGVRAAAATRPWLDRAAGESCERSRLAGSPPAPESALAAGKDDGVTETLGQAVSSSSRTAASFRREEKGNGGVEMTL